jgi:hypothetical protein
MTYAVSQPVLPGSASAVSPVRLRARDLAAQDRDVVPQYQNLHILRDVAREERRPAEQSDLEQIGEAKEHEWRG